jgi:hypothetical protein
MDFTLKNPSALQGLCAIGYPALGLIWANNNERIARHAVLALGLHPV